MTDPIIVGTLLRKKLEAAEDELARLQGVLVTLRADRDRYERRFTTYGNKLREWQELTGFASPSLCEAEITRLRGVATNYCHITHGHDTSCNCGHDKLHTAVEAAKEAMG